MTSPTLLATPEPFNSPPRIRLELSGWTGSAKVKLTRTDADGTQSPVRSAQGGTVTGGAWIGYDNEAPYRTKVEYTATDAAGVSPDSASAFTELDVFTPWLVHPGAPSLSVPVDLAAWSDETEDLTQGVHVVLGRRTPVVITDGQRKAPVFTTTVRTQTKDDQKALESILADGAALLLQVSYAGMDDTFCEYVSVGQVIRSRPVAWWGSPIREWQLPCTVVDSPAGTQLAQRTWTSVTGAYSTWADAVAAYGTWRDLLIDNPGG